MPDERDVRQILEELASRGAIRPARPARRPDAFCGPTVPSRGVPASEMISEDRR
jgi:hypothetical protein